MRWTTTVASGIAAVLLAAASPAGLAAQSQPALPAFAGWQRTGAAVDDHAPFGLNPEQARPLEEFDLQRIERDTYTRGDRTLQVIGYGFREPYGAFGAFTLLRPADAGALDIGRPREEAGADLHQVFFTAGPWLIQVNLDQATAMTPSEMRALAAELPATSENQWPTLPYYLPRKDVVGNSLRFAAGAAGFTAAAPWLPADAVGFNLGAEAASARYTSGDGTSLLQVVVIAYPTPQIARTHLNALQKVLPAGALLKRSGPDLVAVQGQPAADAQALLGAVNYDADVTLSGPMPVGLNALPGIIIGIFVLVGLIIAVAIVVGVMSGGIMNVLRRRFPEHFARFTQKGGVIRLDLE